MKHSKLTAEGLIAAGDWDADHEGEYLDIDEDDTPSDPAAGKVRLFARDGQLWSRDSSGVESGPFEVGGGGAAQIVQRKFGVTAGNGTITLDSTPTAGNKLILTKGSWVVTPSATGFTQAVHRGYSNRMGTILYRDVQSGDTTSIPYLDASNGWYEVVEIAGLAAGNAVVTMFNDCPVFTPMVGAAMTLPEAGLTVVLNAGGSQSASPFLPSPARLTTLGYGGSNGGNDPFCNCAVAFNREADSLTPSFPNTGGFTGDGVVIGAFWPFA